MGNECIVKKNRELPTQFKNVLTSDKLLHHVRTLMISVCSIGKIVFGWLRFSKFSKELITWNCWKCCWITYRLIATFPRNYRVFNRKWLKKYFSGKLQTFNPKLVTIKFLSISTTTGLKASSNKTEDLQHSLTGLKRHPQTKPKISNTV